MSSAFLSLLNAGMAGMSQQPPDVILYTTSWEDYSEPSTPDEKPIKVKTVPLSTKQNRHTEKREAERGKVILCLLRSYLVSDTLTPPHRLFIGHSCLMNLFYEPSISITISTETANVIQDSLLNVWLASFNSEPCQQLRKVATVMNNLLINVNTEV